MERKSFLEGFVVKGLGEGSFFMGLDYYRENFKKLLGFYPYKGTLNLKSDIQSIKKFLKSAKKKYIKGFKENKKHYFGVECYDVDLCGIKAAIIIPEKSMHDKDIIEVIAPVNLRKKFNLKEGSKVKLK